jgi:hypothetical protein
VAIASVKIIQALRQTARKIQSVPSEYRWTHMGACNCGHLAQHVTKMTASEIRRLSQYKAGEWADQAMEYCEASDIPMDHVIGELFALGFEPRDIGHLERLSDHRVLGRLPLGQRHFDFRKRQDVVRYMTVWADMLEEELNERMSNLMQVA